MSSIYIVCSNEPLSTKYFLQYDGGIFTPPPGVYFKTLHNGWETHHGLSEPHHSDI